MNEIWSNGLAFVLIMNILVFMCLGVLYIQYKWEQYVTEEETVWREAGTDRGGIQGAVYDLGDSKRHYPIYDKWN